jgi:hypothetical protein
MELHRLHRAVDELAMWVEDRVTRAPVPFRAADAAELACFGPLPPLPPPPSGPNPWRAPSPVGGAAAPMEVLVSLPTAPARGVAILVPPWKVGRPALLDGWRDLLAGCGYETWLAVPPHHMGRRSPGQRSGEALVTPDVGRLRAGVEQLVLELRVLSALAAARPGRHALVGLSLGGLGAALAATAPESPESLALVAAPLDLGAVLGRTRIGRRYRRLAARAGAELPGPAELARLLAPFDPGRRPAVARRVFLAVGRHDGVATTRAALPVVHGWEVLPRSYPRGHLTLLFACRRVRADLAAFLGDAGPA